MQERRKLTPGHESIRAEQIDATKPDYVLVLPWNLEREICDQLSNIREWGGQFVIPIPEVRVR